MGTLFGDKKTSSTTFLHSRPQNLVMKGSLLLSALLLATARATTIYDFSADSIDGENVDLEKYRGDVVVIVNVATN